jgi:hypothetical protein
MKNTGKQFVGYVFDNYIGNFLGFVVGFASTRLVAHFYTTKSIKNLWGLTARKTVVDKQTFSMMEWAVSIIIGFIVFEVISKWAKKKITPWLNKYRGYLPAPLRGEEAVVAPVPEEKVTEGPLPAKG